VGIDIDGAFRPPGERWQPVSPRLITARLLVLAIVGVLLVIVIAAAAVGGAELPLVVGLLVGLVLVLGWAWWLIVRRVRSYGYVERDEDLLVTNGIMFRRLTIVPYGRMQLVELTAGPIDRSLGLTTVKLHTAALATDATIPGLPPDEAAALRDRLAARGEARSSGM